MGTPSILGSALLNKTKPLRGRRPYAFMVGVEVKGDLALGGHLHFPLRRMIHGDLGSFPGFDECLNALLKTVELSVGFASAVLGIVVELNIGSASAVLGIVVELNIGFAFAVLDIVVELNIGFAFAVLGIVVELNIGFASAVLSIVVVERVAVVAERIAVVAERIAAVAELNSVVAVELNSSMVAVLVAALTAYSILVL
ncbi:hypothetical protein TNCV_309341 [Trichonephila clavipes]|nr:hypothetical protein TNCV_309341 [Trichonephila clavipes]